MKAAPEDFTTVRRADAPRRGVVLLGVMAALAALALLGGTLAVISRTDVRIAARFRRAADALYNADGGVRYVACAIEADLASGALVLDSPVEAVNYTAPPAFEFDPVTRLARTSNTNAYCYRVMGRSLLSRFTIEAVFRRASAFEKGLFGDESFDIKATGKILSYDSSVIANPTPDDSTGEAMAACNGEFLTHQDSLIDGSLLLGEDPDGVRATWTEMPSGGTTITGEPGVPTDRIEPDPLGAASGDLAADFARYAVAGQNDNLTASPPVSPPHNRLLLGNRDVAVLSSGNYYFSQIVIKQGATLTIDASAGPVNIYLSGKMEAKEGCTINTSGRPTDLSIFSNSDEALILKHEGSFKGVIYAPFADVQVRNSGDFYGSCWAGSVEMKNSGHVYVDLSIRQKFLSNKIALLSWKEIR